MVLKVKLLSGKFMVLLYPCNFIRLFAVILITNAANQENRFEEIHSMG